MYYVEIAFGVQLPPKKKLRNLMVCWSTWTKKIKAIARNTKQNKHH
jgi:hypothetical protein